MSRVARSWLGGLLALLVLGGVAPHEARAAGCLAHLLRSVEPGVAGVQDPDRLSLLELAEAGAPASPVSPSPSPAPCKGALCSGQPATPFTTPPVSPPPWTGQLAFPASLPAVTGPGSFAYAILADPPRPVDHASTLFRPPRVPASH